MCMGLGCNASGVISCRIIESKQKRLAAIITNNFIPCNGRFPLIIAIVTMFSSSVLIGDNIKLYTTLSIIGVILIGFLVSIIISKIIMELQSSEDDDAFVMELPPYRRPQILHVIARAFSDKTLNVLYRALVVCIPAGAVIWLLANTYIGGQNIIKILADFLNPIAGFIGLDGYILISFFLSMPANEIFLPILIMSYTSGSSMQNVGDLLNLKLLLTNNGWTYLTALNVVLFSLLHFPCSTTLLTIFKETKSVRFTILSFILPTVVTIIICSLSVFIYNLFIF